MDIKTNQSNWTVLLTVLLVLISVFALIFAFLSYNRYNNFKEELNQYAKLAEQKAEKVDELSSEVDDVISPITSGTAAVTTSPIYQQLEQYITNHYIDWSQSGAGTINISNLPSEVINSTYTDTDTTYSAGTGMTLTDNVFSTNNAEIDHNSLLNYEANRHIDWTNASSNFITTGTFRILNNTNLPASYWGEASGGNVAIYYGNLAAANVNNTITHTLRLRTTAGTRSAGGVRAGFSDITDATRTSWMRFLTAIGGDPSTRMKINTSGNLSLLTNSLLFGTEDSEDTNLYRSAADTLKTDDALVVGGNADIDGVLDWSDNAAKPKIYSQADEPDIANDSTAFWTDTDDSKYYLILDIGGTQKRVELPL